MPVDKLRRLLLAAPAAGLAGCAVPSGGLSKLLGPQMEYGNAKPMSAEEKAQAEKAAAIFAHFMKNKTIPVSRNGGATPLSLRRSVADWNRALVATNDKQKLTYTDTAELSLRFVPMLTQLDAAYASLEKTKARTVRPAPGRFQLNGSVVSIPAGGTCQFSEQGFCLDPGLATPVTGEQFRLVPLERILPSGLHPLYRDLMLASKRDPEIHANMQGLVWLLRSTVNGQRGSSLGDGTRRLFNKARPNGAREFEAVANQEKLLAPIRDIAGIVDRFTVDGQTYDLGHLHDVTASQRAVDNMMRGMANMKVSTPIPNDNSHMSMPDPNLAVMSLGTGMLKPTLSIINASEHPINLDLARYAAVSTRNVQRVAMGIPGAVRGSQFPLVVGGDDSAFSASTLGSVLSSIASDGKNYLADKLPEQIPKIAEKIRPVWALAARSPAIKAMIETVPFVGNLLSAYELFTGTSWQSPHTPLSPAERVLAGFGTLPGAGMIERLAGNSTNALLKWALNSAGAHTVGKIGEVREWIQDANSLATGGTAQAFGLDQPAQQAMAWLQDSVHTAMARI